MIIDFQTLQHEATKTAEGPFKATKLSHSALKVICIMKKWISDLFLKNTKAPEGTKQSKAEVISIKAKCIKKHIQQATENIAFRYNINKSYISASGEIARHIITRENINNQ